MVVQEEVQVVVLGVGFVAEEALHLGLLASDHNRSPKVQED